ncbi:hypothetical protein EA462_16980 [Natrarchaeobius halalkaliphilus]|uniref:DUF7115 domain-containing protein n=1 Tax=Natrarchaeobius halalkaliphilus TaxID=1679091 RepID=A0A3N6LJP6_9EURY|nr:hypothetical protein [Natrarchaeobius halalkaliphilus]RQG86164.1 hypothetical protein EA462_16980 [Natrarchaeobius halalkaliphilus]
MSVPGIVQSTLTDEDIAARVSLGGDDELFITPTRTIVYRAEGLLSDESVDEYPHDADRLTLSEGRRKTKFSLEYPLDGSYEFTVPSSKTDAVLHPVLAGVLNGNEITDPGETVVQTYRFSELTLIITSDRLVKHIGGAVWDDDYEEYHFGDVTNLSFEDGSVATQIVLEVGGRPQRIKAPNEEANDLRERLKRALFDYHDVKSLEQLNEEVGDDGDDDAPTDSGMDFGGGIDPLDTSSSEDGEGDTVEEADGREAAVPDSIDAQPDRPDDDERTRGQSSSSASAATVPSDPNESASDSSEGQRVATVETGDVFENPDDSIETRDADRKKVRSTTGDVSRSDLLERIETLEESLARQNDLLEQQQETIEQLIVELRQGR